jgi:hypothetical protein
MLFAADFPAKTLVEREREPGSPVPVADYGQSSRGSLAKFDRATSSWKTLQCSLVEGLDVFSETWPRSGMMRNGTAYQLPPLVRLTGGIESGLWPTPVGSVAQDGEKPETWLARRERVKKTANNGNGMGMPLTIAVQLWPTPTAVTNTGGAAMCKWGGSRSRQKLRQMVSPQELNGALNPRWVEWLMGYPIGWTALPALETPSCRRSRKKSAMPS